MGGDVTANDGAGGGGGGIGSRATIGTLLNLGNGGSDQEAGQNGNGYGLTGSAGSGGGDLLGGERAGGGGGGAGTPFGGGGGGGQAGHPGNQPVGPNPPGGEAYPSGGEGTDGGGGGGAGVVISGPTSGYDGAAGDGKYGGGGGGGAGKGNHDTNYTVNGGSGGVGGGGGGGGVAVPDTIDANGGNSGGGGGGGGAGPKDGSSASGGQDIGKLGGGSGGAGASSVEANFGGGGGGGGSGLGGAIFVDSGLNFTIQALSGITTTFNTPNNTVTAGTGGTGGPDGENGFDGTALGESIFLRENSSLTFIAENANDVLTLGDSVSFVDDTNFGGSGTSVRVTGNGTVIYNGTSDYQGTIAINNANFKVNGQITQASVNVCRNGSDAQRGTLSGIGTLTGNVFVNSGTISPDDGETLRLGRLTLSAANPGSGTLGSLVHSTIDSGGSSLVAVTHTATLAGVLEIDIDPSTPLGTYILLTSSGITGTFDTVTFTGETPSYTLSYLPAGSPTYVQFELLGYPSNLEPASNFQGTQKKNSFGFVYELYNKLTWSPSSSNNVTGYYIYRGEEKIATVGASVRTYNDNNRPRGISSTYSLVAFDNDGNTSDSVTITVRPK